MRLPPHNRTAREVTGAYESATRPEKRPVCVLIRDDEWLFDASVLPVD